MAGPDESEHAYEAAHAAAPTSPGRPRHRPQRAASDRSFGASLGWAAAGTVLPGLGLTRTRARAVGYVLLVAFVLAVAAVVVGALFARDLALSVLVLPGVMTAAWVAVVVFGVVWVGSIVATHLMLRPERPTWWQRLLGTLVVAVLSLAVAAPSFAAARSIYDTSVFVENVFGSEGADPVTPDQAGGEEDFGTLADPWANKPRLNVLLLGGDAGADREGTRTDTVILASIDTASGDTILFSLPRQTASMPFPTWSPLHKVFPNGFTNGNPLNQDYALSAIYGAIPNLVEPGTLGSVEDPGAEALKQSVGAALGLHVDYYAMVNMEGFVEFVNALGGITVNINQPVPVGGKNPTRVGGSDGFPPDRWLVPGPDQHLNGADALWFARGRYRTTDYARMSRQRCVIQAVVQQAQPTRVLANYESLTKAGSNIVATDMPNRQLPRMVTLGLRVKDASLASVSFEHGKDGFSTTHPDWALVQARVQDAISAPTPPPAPAPDASATPSGTPGASASPSVVPTPSAVPSTSASALPTASATPTPAAPASVVDECAYNPVPWPPVEE